MRFHAQLRLESNPTGALRFLFSRALAEFRQRQCVKHSVVGTMFFASQLRRFRGSAAEACFRALAIAKFRNVPAQCPTVFYVRDERTNREELRRDACILNEMWKLTQKVVAALEAQGVTLR